jgi:hypothetical protein
MSTTLNFDAAAAATTEAIYATPDIAATRLAPEANTEMSNCLAPAIKRLSLPPALPLWPGDR